jgi:hypothetical protein
MNDQRFLSELRAIFGTDDDIDGADLVEWIGEHLPRAPLSDADLAAEITAALNESRARRGQGPIG